ncbi:hypothetical protein [Pseudomonas protegens]|uniref:hypothetical protein n=1 Tax=Pseudomonas protegens TaxID=380021 RepID=UPI003805B332
MNYFKWEGKVVESVTEALQVSCFDAFGIIEVQPFYVQQSWCKGMDTQRAATKKPAVAQGD